MGNLLPREGLVIMCSLICENDDMLLSAVNWTIFRKTVFFKSRMAEHICTLKREKGLKYCRTRGVHLYLSIWFSTSPGEKREEKRTKEGKHHVAIDVKNQLINTYTWLRMNRLTSPRHISVSHWRTLRWRIMTTLCSIWKIAWWSR